MGLPVVQQFLLTRFNIHDVADAGNAGVSRRWLKQRLNLFERYCVPSVAAQTLADFEWLIFCDEATADDDLEHIRACDSRIRIVLTERARALPLAEPRDEAAHGPILQQFPLHQFVKRETEVVISTRLNPDAALHRQALARVRAYLGSFAESEHPTLAYNLGYGYRFNPVTGRLAPSSPRDGALQSWMERVAPGRQALGVLVRTHGKDGEGRACVDDEGARLWMTVQHVGSETIVFSGWPGEASLESVLQDLPTHPGVRAQGAVTSASVEHVNAPLGSQEAREEPVVPILRTDPLQVTVVDDGLVLPSEFVSQAARPTHRGGVVTHWGEIVPSANLYRDGGKLAFGGTNQIPVPESRVSAEEVIYLGWCQHHHFGHFLLETLARAWYTLVADPSLRVVLLPHVRLAFSPMIWRMLELLDIPEERVLLVTEPTRFSRIYVPDVAYELLGSAHEEAIRPFAQMTERVLGGAARDVSSQPVYLSQGGMLDLHKIAAGERDLEAELRERGYRIVYPEMISIDEQIRVFNEHTDYVGIPGPVFHSVLFSRQRPTLHLLAGKHLPRDYQTTPALAGASVVNLQCLADAPDTPGAHVLDMARVLAYLEYGLSLERGKKVGWSLRTNRWN